VVLRGVIMVQIIVHQLLVWYIWVRYGMIYSVLIDVAIGLYNIAVHQLLMCSVAVEL
jgi:hypothetical protein